MSTREIDTIVCDMDGTLFDSSIAIPLAYRSAVLELGGPELEPHEVFARYHLGPPVALLSDALERAASEDCVACYHRHLAAEAGHVRTYHGIEEILERLHVAGIRLAVFTGADTHSAELLLTHAGLRDWFEQVVGSDLVPLPKPAPDGILYTLEQLDVPAAGAAYVGDSPLDQQAARAAGVMALAAGWGHMHDPTEPADHHLERPDQLLELVASPPAP